MFVEVFVEVLAEELIEELVEVIVEAFVNERPRLDCDICDSSVVLQCPDS